MSLPRKRPLPNSEYGNSSNSLVKRSKNATIANEALSLSQDMSDEQITRRSGKILQMRLTNFMCHSNMLIEFDMRMNFLIGSNGSGKSAVLAALVLGLGCKASATNRCSSFKQYIKTGEDSATIEIDICNEGLDSYDYETYGRKIVIVRQLKSNGSSNYKIKNESGNVVSKKADELRKIVLYLNIQADNPIFVLNQDNARSFLKDLDPHKNYTLYLKATQIETVLGTLNECARSYQDLKFRQSCKKKELEMQKIELSELEKKYMRLQSVEAIKEKVVQYNIEKHWAEVIAQEGHVEELRNAIEELTDQANELTQNVNNKSFAEKQIRDKIKATEQELKEVNDTIAEENTKYNNIKRLFDKENENYQNEDRVVQKLKRKENELKTDLDTLEKHIAERSETSTGSIQKLKAANEATLEVLKKNKAEVEAMLENSKRDVNMLNNTKTNLEEKFEDIKRKRVALRQECDHLQRTINATKANSKDNLAIYGPDVSRFLFKIEAAFKQKKLTAMPRGPLGRYIQVPNEKYRGIVEHHLRGVLDSYLVTNSKDRTVLDSILKKDFPQYRPSIITTGFVNEVYDVSGGAVQPPRGTRLLMDEIRCSDNVVMNCLIDRGEIESILVADEKGIAEHLTSNRENVPQNLQRVYLLNPGLEYYPAPAYRMYSLKLRPPRIIQVNMEQRIRQMEEEVAEKARNITNHEQDLTTRKDEMAKIYQKIANDKKILDRHEEKKRDLIDKIREIEQIEYPNSNELEMLKKEMEEISRKIENISEQIVEKQKLAESSLQSKADYEFKVRKQKDQLREIEINIQQLKTVNENEKIKLNSLLNSAKHNDKKLQDLEQSLEQQRTEKETEIKVLKKLTIAAEKEGARIETKRSEQELTQIISKLERKIQQTTSSNENVDDIKNLLDAKTKTYEKSLPIVTQLEKSIEDLKMSRLNRFVNIRSLKHYSAVKVKYIFINCLKRRNFTGELQVNHGDKTLKISVIPRDSHVGNAVSSTKSLSGGERSYSTIAFLIALWSCVDHPFYFLDEYDVFTDQVNREIMTRLLIAEGTERVGRQYTFLTPQEMSIAATDTIKIHKLNEPQR